MKVYKDSLLKMWQSWWWLLLGRGTTQGIHVFGCFWDIETMPNSVSIDLWLQVERWYKCELLQKTIQLLKHPRKCWHHSLLNESATLRQLRFSLLPSWREGVHKSLSSLHSAYLKTYNYGPIIGACLCQCLCHLCPLSVSCRGQRQVET